jgi:hypothetical protein
VGGGWRRNPRLLVLRCRGWRGRGSEEREEEVRVGKMREGRRRERPAARPPPSRILSQRRRVLYCNFVLFSIK